MNIDDTVRALTDEQLQTLYNHSDMLTPVAQREVAAEVSRRLREMRGQA